jgi:hypothetical protein
VSRSAGDRRRNRNDGVRGVHESRILMVAGYRKLDGKIKAGVPRVAKPLAWLSFLRAVGRAVVPRAGKRFAFSNLSSALAIQSGPEGAHEQRR